MIKLVLLPLWYGNKDIIRDNLSGRHIVENFDIVSIQHYPKEEEIHIHLDEKKSIPVEFSSRRVVFNGFTSAVSRNGRLCGTAEEYVLFPENIGTHLSIDETCLSHDELYTIVTNKAFKGRKGSLVAMVKGKAIDAENERIKLEISQKRQYVPKTYENGETRRQLIAMSKHLLLMHPQSPLMPR